MNRRNEDGQIKVIFEHILPEGCNPLKWEQLRESEVEEHRFILCEFYQDCLSYTAGLHWQSWSCRWCSHWSETNGRKRRKNDLYE